MSISSSDITGSRRFNSELSVLIVDKSDTDRAHLKVILQTFGLIRVSEASNGSQALRMIIQNGCPDIILTEVATHPLSGLQLLRVLRRARGPSAQVPLIMLTSLNDRAMVLEARALKCAAWVLKPYDPKHLFDHMSVALNRAEKTRPVPDLPAPPARSEAVASRPKLARRRSDTLDAHGAPNIIDFASARARLLRQSG